MSDKAENCVVDAERQAVPLIGDYGLEDFYTEKPYLAIYNEKNKFLQRVMIIKTGELAKNVGFKGFTAAWRDFQSTKAPQDVSIANDDNIVAFEGLATELNCGPYNCAHNVTKLNMYGVEEEVISHPLVLISRVTNIETLEAKREIAFRRGGKGAWRKLVVSRDVLSSAQRITALAKQDVEITSENAKEVVKYLSFLDSANYDALPEKSSVSRLGWLPDGSFAPFSDGVEFDGDNAEYRKLFECISTPVGSEDEWMNVASSARHGESIACRIALAAGFAAPLVERVNALSFIVHLWGQSGMAKTVGLMLSASIWGDPELGSYLKRFDGTQTSMEATVSFLKNLPFALDDLKLQDSNDKKNFDTIIYQLCAGSNKPRATRNAEARYQKKWRTCIVSNSEAPILRDDSANGAENRVIEVNYGGTPFFGTDERAKEVSFILKNNYGFAGRKFIKALQSKTPGEWVKLLDKYLASLPNSSEVDSKLRISAAVLLLADAIATDTIFHDGMQITAADVAPFLTKKKDADENIRCYYYFSDWVIANSARFDPSDDNKGMFYGIVEGDWVYIMDAYLDEALRGRFNKKVFMLWLRDHNLLECDSEDRLSTRKVLKQGRPQQRCRGIKIGQQIALDAAELHGKEGKNDIRQETEPDGYQQVDVDDLPF